MALVACVNSDFEWDMRKNIDTSAAADSAASNIRAQADQNGVITYPTYQVGIARKNDTVASVQHGWELMRRVWRDIIPSQPAPACA